MNQFWWIAGAAGVLAAALAGLVTALWPHWKRRRDSRRLEHARQLFHLRREWLEADFVKAAAAGGRPRGLVWSDCNFEDDVLFASDRQTNQLRAFVGATVSFTAVDGGGMEDNPQVRQPRMGTAVFDYDGHRWHTDGRMVFNLRPRDAAEQFQHHVELIDQKPEQGGGFRPQRFP